MSLGSFAGGFAEGLHKGTESRRRRAIATGLERENRRQQAIDVLREEAAGLSQAEVNDPGNYVQSGIPLQGPAAPGGAAPQTVNVGERVQELRRRAMASGDENSINLVNELGMRGAMSHVMAARNAQSPDEEMAALKKAEDILGLPGSFKRAETGEILNPWGDSMADPRVRQGTYDWMLQAFKDPATASKLYGESQRADRAEDREDTKVDLAWSRLFSDSQYRNQRLTMDQEQFRDRLELEYRKFGLDAAELGMKGELYAAQADYYKARAAGANAEAAAYQQQPVWGKQSDLINAMDKMDGQYDDAFVTDPMFAVEGGEQLAMMARTMGKEAVAEHGPAAMADALEGSKVAAAYISGSDAVQNVQVAIDDETGKAYLIEGSGGRNNTYPISRDTHDYLAQMMDEKRAAGSARALEDSRRQERQMTENMTRDQGLDTRVQFKGPGSEVLNTGLDKVRGWFDQNPARREMAERLGIGKPRQ